MALMAAQVTCAARARETGSPSSGPMTLPSRARVSWQLAAALPAACGVTPASTTALGGAPSTLETRKDQVM